MDGLMEELLAWCRQERSTMLDSIRRMESGELRVGSTTTAGLVDETKDWTATLRRRVAELDQLLAAYGKSKAPRA